MEKTMENELETGFIHTVGSGALWTAGLQL